MDTKDQFFLLPVNEREGCSFYSPSDLGGLLSATILLITALDLDLSSTRQADHEVSPSTVLGRKV